MECLRYFEFDVEPVTSEKQVDEPEYATDYADQITSEGVYAETD